MNRLSFPLAVGDVVHVWFAARDPAASATLDVLRDGVAVATLRAAPSDEALRHAFTAAAAGRHELVWDDARVAVSLAYAYHPDRVLDDGIALLAVTADNVWPETRPRYHFTPPWGWMNDPNGVAALGDRLHVFYQHMPHHRRRPRSMMYWGHVATRDGLAWTHLPVFLPPREELLRDGAQGGGAYSGSAIPRPDGDGLRLFFTDRQDDRRPEREWQMTAVTRDLIAPEAIETAIDCRPDVAGLRNDFRDPYVFRGPDGLWKMLLAGRTDRGVILLYETADADARDGWRFVGTLYEVAGYGPGPAECPCMLPLGGDLWVLIVSLISHDKPTRRRNLSLAVVGRFDGRALTPVWSGELDYGTDCYAFQGTLRDGEAMGIGWAANWSEISRQEDALTCATLPRALRWRGDHLATPPVDAALSLRERRLGALTAVPTVALADGAAEIDIELAEFGAPLRLTVDGLADRVAFVVDADGMRLEHGAAPDGPLYRAAGRPRALRLFVDVGLVEVFADDGRWCFTKRLADWSPAASVTLASPPSALRRADVWSLKTTAPALRPLAVLA